MAVVKQINNCRDISQYFKILVQDNCMRQLKYILLVFIFCAALQAQDKSEQKIYIFYSNDLQAGIGKQRAVFMNPNFPPVLGGGPAASGILKKFRKKAETEGDVVLLLDAGDIFYSSKPIGKESKGLAVIDYMNTIGYNAMVPGNHDFDLGQEVFTRIAESAAFPVLAANLNYTNKQEEPGNLKSHMILQAAGLRIGVLGIVSKSAEQNDDLTAVDGFIFSDEVPAAKEAVAALKKEGADVIIALAHLGLPYNAEEGYTFLEQAREQNIEKNSYVNGMDLAAGVPGIDVLVSGKIHRGYNEPWEDPENHTICVQNYANGGNLGLLILNIDKGTKKISGYQLPSVESGLLLLSEDEFWPENQMTQKIKSLQDQYESGFDDVIGITTETLYRSDRGESPLGNLMCDAMLEASGADFVFNNFTGMRLDIPIGAITPRDAADVFPFGNEIVVIELKGSLLKSLMEGSVRGAFAGLAISGGKVEYNSNFPDGNKITLFKIGENELDVERTYKAATTEYLAEGSYGMNALAFLPEEKFNFTGIVVRDAVVNYIRKNSPLQVKEDGRWIRN